MKKNFVFLVALFVVVGITLSCNKEKAGVPAQTSQTPAASQQKAPDFTLKDLNGNDFRLFNQAGKVIIVDFWATWCPPCRMEIPDFQSLYSKYSNQGLLLVGVSLDDSSEPVKEFVKKYNVSYPVVMGNEQVANSYGGIRGIPTTFVIDGKGNIYKKYIGYTEGQVFEQDILALLKK